jgi:hypothetical protein
VVGSAADTALRAAVAGMPAPSRPRRWLHADALPRTAGGKLRRDALPDLVKLSKPLPDLGATLSEPPPGLVSLDASTPDLVATAEKP